MLTVIFYGELRRNFGRRFVLDVHSPREAIHALSTQLVGLRAWFGQHATQQFLVRGAQDYDLTDIDYPQSTGILKVVPLIEGAGAFPKIIAGIGLVAIGIISGGTLAPAMISMGLALAMSGVSQMLAPRPASPGATPEKADNQPSLAFDGAVNTMGQGGPVPLGYGRMIIGSQIISVGFSTNNEIVVA
ncbi:tail assembly protein [Paraburkholderia sp. RL18-103-BIB-C]|uniref:tail assembly protein n=1 Tax=Paraburkholderia sp. RL18-103-BIB-C TaxID=3031637 RepID=UPI0038BA33BB